MTKLTPEAQAIVDAGREALSATPGTKEQILSAVQASVADPLAGGSALSKAAGGAGSLKLALVLALLAAMGGGLWWFGSGERGGQEQAIREETPAVEPVTEALTAPPREESIEEPPLVVEEIEEPPESPAGPATKTARKPKTKHKVDEPKPAVNTLLAERKLIAAAQVAIREREYQLAQSILRDHKKKFPSGILSPERDAARAIALCLDDNEKKGSAAARSFLKAHGDSPLAKRVKSTCKIP